MFKLLMVLGVVLTFEFGLIGCACKKSDMSAPSAAPVEKPAAVPPQEPVVVPTQETEPDEEIFPAEETEPEESDIEEDIDTDMETE
ncbi:MAG: hypothetical protein JW983_07920 [Elusimicrobia bacterium]|nr:hypothetical protein [Elusimicrobiota bacterium]